MKNLILIFTLVFYWNFATAQTSEKMDAAIEAISTTEFMLEFDSTTLKIEELAIQIKENSEAYELSDFDEIETAYNKSATKYNSLLIMVRDDLLDKSKLKMMTTNPELFSDSYTLKLSKANEFCNDNFYQTVNEVHSRMGIDGSIFAILLAAISATFELVESYKNHKNQIKKMDKEVLNEKFVDPHKLPLWDDLVIE